MQGSARNEREHVSAKLVSSHGRLDLTGYLSYDSIHEDVYQRLNSEGDFEANPRLDRLIGDWLPPFIVDVTDDDGGPESELMGGTPVRGGTHPGRIRFVSPNGVAVGPTGYGQRSSRSWRTTCSTRPTSPPSPSTVSMTATVLF